MYDISLFYRFAYVPAPHTAEVIADTLVDALMIGILIKVSTITVDNCTTNDAMINHLLDKLPKHEMPLDGKVTEMFSGTLYPTSNFYFPKLCDIKVKLDEWMKSPNVLVQDMALRMLGKYDKYWDVCHILMGVAAVLDPRYKMNLVEFFFRKIYRESASFKIDEVRQNCYDLLLDYQSKCCTLNESGSSIGGEKNTMSSVVDGDVNVDESLDEFEEFVVSKITSGTNVTVTAELDMYLEESLLPRTRDFDILNWWKTNGVKFPTLQKMARDILAIPVSTVASESAFSSSGKTINSYRNRLSHNTVEALMCSRRWLWNEVNDTCSTSDGVQTCPSIVDEEDDQDNRDE
ncbi:UNVERIFIED_CONTAM: putative AC transposase [Sesamum radiatum]|uniref:AC transposase n=1 Tax=Sesamum radiatum TaxID=300843 RepID=A0AAW2L391_SESRA